VTTALIDLATDRRRAVAVDPGADDALDDPGHPEAAMLEEGLGVLSPAVFGGAAA